MAPQPINLRRKPSWNMIADGLPVYAIEDYKDVGHLIKPQTPNDCQTLHPDVAFLFGRANTYFFTVNVAMDADGNYLFGYDLFTTQNGSGCYPSLRWKDHKKAKTLKRCLVNALTYIKGWDGKSEYWTYPLYAKAATEALKKIKKPSLVQMTIFDMLDDTI